MPEIFATRALVTALRITLAICDRCREPIFDDEPYTPFAGNPPRGIHKECGKMDSDDRQDDA